ATYKSLKTRRNLWSDPRFNSGLSVDRSVEDSTLTSDCEHPLCGALLSIWPSHRVDMSVSPNHLVDLFFVFRDGDPIKFRADMGRLHAIYRSVSTISEKNTVPG